VSCSGQDTWSVAGSYTYKDSGTFKVTVTVNDSDGDSATGQTDAAAISDQELAAVSAANVKGTEAGKVKVTAIFKDSNPAFSSDESVDPGLSATIDWGDGTTSKADKIAWDDSNESNVRVTGSHLYDANTGESSYTIKVTLRDDGSDGSAMTTSHATIGDAKLTAGAAKSFVATGAQASTPVVASFTDAAGAQAKAADFTGAINWGDGTSSAGTLTQTGAGAFDVSGTHTYATAGTKSLTITVTDEEGQTLSMTATATVPALPATGQPQNPAQPTMPWLPLFALVFAMAIAGGTSLVLRRIRN
jgi:PKD repeat protein